MPWTFYNSSGQRLSSAATNISVLDIDGATDIGAAIVDADLFIIDDGAGGTNRKTAASRIVTYVGADTDTRSGVAKGRAYLNSAGANSGAYNVASSARDGTGDFSVTWTTDFSDTNYQVSFMGDAGSAYSWVHDARAVGVTGYLTFNNTDDGAANLGGSIVVFGDQ